jgi:hypothetical protein
MITLNYKIFHYYQMQINSRIFLYNWVWVRKERNTYVNLYPPEKVIVKIANGLSS